MNTFGKTSERRQATLYHPMVLLNRAVLVHFDVSILCTTRGRTDQEAAFNAGLSHAKFGESPHNYETAFGEDVGVWCPLLRNVSYNDIEMFRALTDCYKAHAPYFGIEIVCGIDWHGLLDPGHIEVKNWPELVRDVPLFGG